MPTKNVQKSIPNELEKFRTLFNLDQNFVCGLFKPKESFCQESEGETPRKRDRENAKERLIWMLLFWQQCPWNLTNPKLRSLESLIGLLTILPRIGEELILSDWVTVSILQNESRNHSQSWRKMTDAESDERTVWLRSSYIYFEFF